MSYPLTKLPSTKPNTVNYESATLVPAHTNWFLANLPENDYNRIKPDLEYVALHGGDTLHNSGEAFHHIYFPVSCLISSLLVSKEGSDVEVETIGAEGFVGHSAILGSRLSGCRSFVAIGGAAWRLPVGWFKEEFKFGGCLHDFALYHLQCQLTHSNQLTLCHRLHSIEERLCRWLLSASDALGSKEIPLTHEVLAQLLGSRRPGITIALNILRQAGFIDSHRGRIIVLDHQELSHCACECYGVIREAREKSVAAMVRRGGPINCTRNLLSRQSELLRAKSGDMREKSRSIHSKAESLRTQSEVLLGKMTQKQTTKDGKPDARTGS